VGAGERLKRVKEELRSIPRKGIGYGLLRYLNDDLEIGARLRALPQAEVRFNYLGQFDQTLPSSAQFGFASESCGATSSLQGMRGYLLRINGGVMEGQLQMTWNYSENLHERRTIERLAENFNESLRSLIAHCKSPEAGGYTPSDFPDANVSQLELDNLIAKLSQLAGRSS
jgi:non-ribosomal peptide synthase protein (TIGR01720 family)